MNEGEWFAYMQEMAEMVKVDVLAVGLMLRHALLRAPTTWGSAARKQKLQSAIAAAALKSLGGPGRSVSKDHGDLLPLPFGMSEEDVEWDLRAATPPKLLQQHGPNWRELCSKAWRDAMVLTLNSLAEAPQSLEKKNCKCFATLGSSPKQANEHEALRILDKKIHAFLDQVVEAKSSPKTWGELLNSRLGNYGGPVLTKARQLSLSQVLSGLPPEGMAAQVDAHWLATGFVKELLADPSKVLKDKALWPKRARKSTVMASKEEAWAIAAELVKRGVFRIADDDEEVLDGEGNPVTAGLFGIGKGKWPEGFEGSDLHEILRLIINLIGSNDLMDDLQGETSTLPYLGQWRAISLEKGCWYHWSGEDLRCAFYLLRLPKPWGKFFVINMWIPGHLLGSPRAWERVCCNVVPMGWKLAVAVAQHCLRRLAAHSEALPPSLELRRDRPPPCDDSFFSPTLWEAFIDDLSKGRAAKKGDEDQTSGWLLAVRETGEPLGFVFDDGDKRQDNTLDGVSLGSAIVGKKLLVMPKPGRILDGLGLAATLMSSAFPKAKHVEIVGGLWIFLIQYAPAVMACGDEIWNIILGKTPPEKCAVGVATDFLPWMTLAPLLQIDLGMDTDGLPTCSDASETGGGVCAALKLTARGRARLQEAKAFAKGEIADSLVLVEHCGGIGAARRALEILGVRPGCHLLTEIHEPAIRVQQAAFPGVIPCGDLADFSAEVLAEALKEVPDPQFLLEVAGTPCQDLSGANAAGQGLQGKKSKLFWTLEAKKDIYDVVLPKARKARLLENVVMKEDDANLITRERAAKPVRCCPVGRFCLRRPRLFWADWSLENLPNSNFKVGSTWDSLQLEGPRLSVRGFLAPHERVQPAFDAFPCFMQSTRRSKPPWKPAGLESCDQATVQRWEKEEYRYPPYQFKLKYLLKNSKTHELAPPASPLREELMGFRRDHTFAAMDRTARKSSPQAFEDERCSLLGNSIHAPTLAFLISPVLVEWGLLKEQPSLDQICAVAGRCGRLTENEEVELARAYMTFQTHRGGEIRLESGPQKLPGRAPIQAVDPGHWEWRTVLSCQWHAEHEHISALETRAYLLTLKWKLRSCARMSKRFLHLVDSQTAFGALTKHRSPSPLLQYLVRRAAAMELAGNLAPCLAYCHSHRNPADFPSRCFQKSSLKRQQTADEGAEEQ